MNDTLPRTRVAEGNSYRITFEVRNGSLFADGRWPTNVREAMEVTLVKWTFLLELARAGELVLSGGSMTCGLCQITEDELCLGCPVMETSGRSGCLGTPFFKYGRSVIQDDLDGARIEAEAELEFLKGIEV